MKMQAVSERTPEQASVTPTMSCIPVGRTRGSVMMPWLAETSMPIPFRKPTTISVTRTSRKVRTDVSMM